MPLKRAALLAAVALAGLATGQARAQVQKFYSSNELLEVCDSKKAFEQGECKGFVSGVADTLWGGDYARFRTCIPKSVTAGQVQNVVVRYLRAHPQNRTYTAASQAARALQDAFPCR